MNTRCPVRAFDSIVREELLVEMASTCDALSVAAICLELFGKSLGTEWLVGES